MRFHELFEYKRDVTVDTYSGKLKKISSNDPEETLKEIEKGDPSFHKIYVLWIIKQLDNGLIKLEDMSRTHEMLSSYDDLKKHLPIEQRDMNKFTYHELYDIVDNALNADIDSSAKQTLDIEGVDDDEYKLIHNSPLGTLVIPKTENAACVLGKRTSWCTATKTSANYFDDYGKDETLYIWLDKIHNQKYQFHFESVEFKDSKDKDIDWDILKDWRNNHSVLSDMFKEGEKRLGIHNVDNYEEDEDNVATYIENIILDENRLPFDLETKLLNASSLDFIVSYIHDYDIHDTTDIDNNVINQIRLGRMSLDVALKYRYYIKGIQSRWPEIEEYLFSDYIENRDTEILDEYMDECIRGRWPEFEDELIIDLGDEVDMNLMKPYMENHIKERWKEGENALLDSIYWKLSGDDDYIEEELNCLDEYAKNILGIKLPQWKELMKVLKEYDYELPEGY